MNIELKEINCANVGEVCALEVYENQKGFVAPNALSLAEAFAAQNERLFVKPFGIYDNDALIGFIMISYGKFPYPDEPPVAEGNYLLWRFMIDKKFQGKHYSGLVLQNIVEYIKTCPAGKADCVWLSYESENEHAKSIYSKFGFKENGEMCGDEIVAVYDLK